MIRLTLSVAIDMKTRLFITDIRKISFDRVGELSPERAERVQRCRRADDKLRCIAGGLFMIFQNINVSSNWGGYFFHIGSFHIANGMIMLPAIIGIGMLFLMHRKIFGWIVLAIGVVIILLSVLLTTHLAWRTTSAYIFIIMFGLTAAGAGMVLRELFRKD